MVALKAAASASLDNKIHNPAEITVEPVGGSETILTVNDDKGFTIEDSYIAGFGGSDRVNKANGESTMLKLNFPALDSMTTDTLKYVLTSKLMPTH